VTRKSALAACRPLWTGFAPVALLRLRKLLRMLLSAVALTFRRLS
jgi:hypothetical protein